MKKRITIPFNSTVQMIWTYISQKVMIQIRAALIIFIYLLVFQTLVFQSPLSNAFGIALGITMVILGLTLFLEGIFLGLMPLGEKVGLVLPMKGGLPAVLLFGLLLGTGATFAEPALSALRTAGGDVTPWDAPLLFTLLEIYPNILIFTVGFGVGLAVALGMLRFSFGLSLKPFIFVIIPILLGLSLFATFHPAYSNIVGLAWDTGAVTTGVVTVPLVLALGIGVSRTSGSVSNNSGGFGIVMLASAIPIVAVLLVGMLLTNHIQPVENEATFFTTAREQSNSHPLSGRVNFDKLVFQRGSEEGRRAFYLSESLYLQSLKNLAENPQELLESKSLDNWLETRASDFEVEYIQSLNIDQSIHESTIPLSVLLATETLAAARAILPLSGFLVILLFLVLRERTKYQDEVVLGILIAFFGMILITSGIFLGLAPLGDVVGRQIPQELNKDHSQEIVIRNFDRTQLFTGYNEQGNKILLIPIIQSGNPVFVPFVPSNFNSQDNTYTYNQSKELPFNIDRSILGLLLVLLFCFGLGYGSTIAEPALAALGRTVETLTVGTVKGQSLIAAVSLGVGIGIVIGVVRILFDIPLIYLLLPGYGISTILTMVSEEDFVGIAWDCGGVTTGPITVPLVLALGLGISGELGIYDGFGILALSSMFPIITVLGYGILVRIRQGRIMHDAEGTQDGN